MHLRSKTDFRNISESWELRRKYRAKPSQSTHFATFSLKKPLYLLKNENAGGFSIVKISVTTNFMSLQ